MIRYPIRRLLYFLVVALGVPQAWLATDWRKNSLAEKAAILPVWAIFRGGFLLAMHAYLFYCWLVY